MVGGDCEIEDVLFFMFIKIECIVAYLPKNNQIKGKK